MMLGDMYFEPVPQSFYEVVIESIDILLVLYYLQICDLGTEED